MKPLGTITMYYKFLDKEIVSILDAIMRDAEDYRDFCERLIQKVCSEDVPTVLGYLAGVHACKIGNLGNLEKLRSKYGDIAHIQAWLPDTTPSRIIKKDTAVKESLSKNLEDWIIVEMYYLLITPPELLPVLQVRKFLSKGKNLIQNNPKLECFLPDFLNIQAKIKREDGSHVEGIVDIERGLDIAKNHDDRYIMTSLLVTLGNLKRETSINESWSFFEDAHKIAESIGFSKGTIVAMVEMGKVAALRGEYDLAIQCLTKSEEECRESQPFFIQNALNSMFMDIALSFTRTFCSMGDGVEALNWAEITIERDQGSYYSIIEKAHALILLGRLREAAVQIDIANDLVLKDGREWAFGLYKFVSGLLELAEDKTLEGIQTLEEAFGIFDQINLDIFAVPCLIALAKAEVKSYDIGGDLDTSGPWMSRLEQRAREQDYPGILMEHALLKAEFQMKQDAPEAAKKTLNDALNIYDSPSIKTLRKKIEERLQSLMIDV